MCITLATAAALASTAVVTYSAIQTANAQKAQAEYNAAVARNNSIISSQNEADIIQRGEVARGIQRTRIAQTIGSARAAIAGSGLLLQGGEDTTSGALLGDLQTAGQFDIMTLKSNIDREARRARIEGVQFQAQAGLFDLQASSINPALAGATAGLKQSQTIFNTLPSDSPVFGRSRTTSRSGDLIG
jgi:hypothetical protein